MKLLIEPCPYSGQFWSFSSSYLHVLKLFSMRGVNPSGRRSELTAVLPHEWGYGSINLASTESHVTKGKSKSIHSITHVQCFHNYVGETSTLFNNVLIKQYPSQHKLLCPVHTAHTHPWVPSTDRRVALHHSPPHSGKFSSSSIHLPPHPHFCCITLLLTSL